MRLFFMKILKTYKFKKQVNVNQRALGCLVTAKFSILFHLDMDSNHFLRDFSDNIGLFHLINF